MQEVICYALKVHLQRSIGSYRFRSPPPQLVFSAEEYDPLHTISALNMAAVSISRILSTQDRIVLDQEYQSIMNNLNLANIRSDPEITALYLKMLDIISRKRLRAEESSLLQARYDDAMKNRLASAVSSGMKMTAVLAGGERTGTLKFLGSIAAGVTSGYFAYQESGNKIRAGMAQDSWRLRAAEISDITEIQKQLLASSWSLSDKYNLPENARLVEKNIKDFHQTVGIQDSSQRLRMLRELERELRAYPPYWYYRAKAARESGNAEEGRKCLDEFAGVWRPVLRQDTYMLEVCKFRVSDLLSGDVSADNVRDEAVKYLDIAREHTPRSDWADNLFIGTAYYELGEKEKGIACVRVNIDFGHEKEISTAVLRHMQKGGLDAGKLSEELKYLVNKNKVIPLKLLPEISGTIGKAEALNRAKQGFMALYKTEWGNYAMLRYLNESIYVAAEREKDALRWWKYEFSIDTEKVQEEALRRFSARYEPFLRSFQNKYYIELGADLRKNSRARDFIIFEKQKLPARFTQNSNSARNYDTSRWSWWQWIVLPLWYAAEWIFTAVMWLFEAIAAVFLAIAGGFVGAYRFFFAEDPAVKVRAELMRRNQAIYTTELPAKYWAEIEPIIKKVTELSND